MPVREVRRDAEGLPYRLLLSRRMVPRLELALWTGGHACKAHAEEKSAWVDRHAGPGSQLELFGEAPR